MNWNEDLTELTPQRRQEREREEQERRDKNYLCGRRVMQIVLIVYVAMQLLSMFFGFVAQQRDGRLGNYLFTCIFRVVLVAVFVRGLWLGRWWARNLFAVVLVLGILFKAWDIVKLGFGLDEADSTSFIAWDVQYSEGEVSEEAILEYQKEALAKAEELKKARAKERRGMIAAQSADIVLCALFLYILFGAPPVKEFFERQAALAGVGRDVYRDG